MDPILGSIVLFPWDWQTEGWLKCNGALLSIQQYTALYSLLGTEFGGDGRSNFALPNLPPLKDARGGTLDYYIAVQGVYPYRS